MFTVDWSFIFAFHFHFTVVINVIISSIGAFNLQIKQTKPNQKKTNYQANELNTHTQSKSNQFHIIYIIYQSITQNKQQHKANAFIHTHTCLILCAIKPKHFEAIKQIQWKKSNYNFWTHTQPPIQQSKIKHKKSYSAFFHSPPKQTNRQTNRTQKNSFILQSIFGEKTNR